MSSVADQSKLRLAEMAQEKRVLNQTAGWEVPIV
jgi:hypothetical protein